MTTKARIGHGSVFSIATADSPTDYVTISEVTSITPPKLSRDTIDATSNDSAEKWREFIAGLKDGGEMSVEMNFIPESSGNVRILGSFNSDRALKCKIVFPDSPTTQWAFDAFCTGYEPADPVDDKMSATVTFKLTGKPDFIGA